MTIKIKKQWVAFAVTFGLVSLGFWLYGIDFDHRGEDIAGWYCAAIIPAIVVYFVEKENQKHEN